MMTNDLGDLAVLAQVTELFEQLCVTIHDDQWGLSTPCTEWNLDQLVDHVTGGNRFTVSILDGQSADKALQDSVESFDLSHRVAEAAISSSRALIEAFSSPGVLDRPCHHVIGDVLGRVVLQLRLHDIIIHTWDIAQTLKPPATLPNELVSWALADLSGPDSLAAKHFDLDTSGLRIAREHEQSPQVLLLSAFGR
jgi:uncharacterized protein (TIGR03086 family)